MILTDSSESPDDLDQDDGISSKESTPQSNMGTASSNSLLQMTKQNTLAGKNSIGINQEGNLDLSEINEDSENSDVGKDKEPKTSNFL